ncbi:DUF4762 family protein [Pantoea sp. 1.19]|uniref:DUF4762 family protein n=1 Tax=Pantoea sp. 1.19 TaxID=1925589 RepID=UPI000948C21C|nr:DUF4762 family protein [Pantoea sp. 1.19]
MKKMNIAEAARVIGGTCYTCKTHFDLVSDGTSKTCKEITTCTDKHGKVVSSTSKNVASSNCGVVN